MPTRADRTSTPSAASDGADPVQQARPVVRADLEHGRRAARVRRPRRPAAARHGPPAAPVARLLALGQPGGDVEGPGQGAVHVLAQPLDRRRVAELGLDVPHLHGHAAGGLRRGRRAPRAG